MWDQAALSAFAHQIGVRPRTPQGCRPQGLLPGPSQPQNQGPAQPPTCAAGESLFSQLLAGGAGQALLVFAAVTLASFAPAIRKVRPLLAVAAARAGLCLSNWPGAGSRTRVGGVGPLCGGRVMIITPCHPLPRLVQVPFEDLFGKGKQPPSLGPFTADAEIRNGRAAMVGGRAAGGRGREAARLGC